MNQTLNGKHIAILATDGFEESELFEPKMALEKSGAKVDVISPSEDATIKSWKHTDWGKSVNIDYTLDDADADYYDGLVLPGGVMSPDRLRMNEKAVDFVKKFVQAGKPIAAICHGPWLLIEANVVGGRRVTSWPSLKTDLMNAGANWVNEEVVVDGGLITSRKPQDLPVFNQKMIEKFAEGPHPYVGVASMADDISPGGAISPL